MGNKSSGRPKIPTSFIRIFSSHNLRQVAGRAPRCCIAWIFKDRTFINISTLPNVKYHKVAHPHQYRGFYEIPHHSPPFLTIPHNSTPFNTIPSHFPTWPSFLNIPFFIFFGFSLEPIYILKLLFSENLAFKFSVIGTQHIMP